MGNSEDKVEHEKCYILLKEGKEKNKNCQDLKRENKSPKDISELKNTNNFIKYE